VCSGKNTFPLLGCGISCIPVIPHHSHTPFIFLCLDMLIINLGGLCVQMGKKEHGQLVKGGDPPPLLCSAESTCGVLCSVLGSVVLERQGTSRGSPVKGCKGD